jgi:hypothetical protein
MPAMADGNRFGSSDKGSEQEVELQRIVNLTPQMLAVMDADGRISLTTSLSTTSASAWPI